MEIITPDNYQCATIYKIRKTEIDKINFELCEQPTETLEHFYNRQEVKPDFLFNGGFFAMNTGNTVFTYVDEGKEIAINNDYMRGIGIKNNELIIGTYNKDFTDFVSGYPVLIENGNIVDTEVGSEINYNAKRTIIGFDDFCVYLIFIDSPGYSFPRIRGMLSYLGIPNAVNLDGGGSMRLLKDGKKVLGAAYSRPVDNVVEIFLKKEEPRIIYRVQTGAFAVLENAEKYRDKIRTLPDEINAGYKNAYIRKINNLYKVQVGAFGVKANAEKVLNDLKSKGYNSFITTL